MAKRESKALEGRCFNISGEILSKPEAVDLRDEIAKFNSDIVKLFVRT